jgi:hypothetical protein
MGRLRVRAELWRQGACGPGSAAVRRCPVASRVLHLGANKEEEVSFAFRTRAAGWLEARLLIDDALADDNRAVLELPA